MKLSFKIAWLGLGAVAVPWTTWGANFSALSGVPDWNQPGLADANLPAGQQGPLNNPLWPGGATSVAWCVPSAAANIMGYYRDQFGFLVGDNAAFPNSGAQPATDLRDGMLDNSSANGPRLDLGWHLNTNDQGVRGNNGYTGTLFNDIRPGLVSYFAAQGYAPSITDFSLGNPFPDNSGVGGQHTIGMAYARIKNEIDAGRPVLVHFGFWNPINRANVRGGGPGGLPDYDSAQWGNPVASDPVSGEIYQTGELGHTVTAVGYWDGGVGSVNPFQGQGQGGSTPDAIIVYDSTDGTLGGPARALALVVPFTADPTAGLGTPWVMETEISGVPEPAGIGMLTGLGLTGFAVLRRLRRFPS